MWHIILADKSLICRIEKYQGTVGQSVVDPHFQLCAGESSACGVVGVAKIYDIGYRPLGKCRHKTVFGGDREIDYVAPGTLAEHTAAPSHYICVYVDGIDGIGHCHDVVLAQYVAEVARVALGAVADEYFRRVDFDAAATVIVVGDCLTQEQIALFGSVAMECGGVSFVGHGFLHCLDGGRAQRLCDIADTHAYDFYAGVRLFEGVDSVCYLREKVAFG